MKDGKHNEHYSCTCLEAEGAVHADLLSCLARVQVRLEFGSRLHQTVDRQALGHAQMRFVEVLMDDAMSLEGSGRPFVVDATGREASALAHKTEGRYGSQPGKPLGRIWEQVQFALLRADHEIVATSSIFDERKQGTPSAFRWMGQGPLSA